MFFGHDHCRRREGGGGLRAVPAVRTTRRRSWPGSSNTICVRSTLSGPGAGPSKRALYRYCRDLKDRGPESIVLSLADAKATSEVMPAEGFTDTQKLSGQVLDYYYGKYRTGRGESPL